VGYEKKESVSGGRQDLVSMLKRAKSGNVAPCKGHGDSGKKYNQFFPSGTELSDAVRLEQCGLRHLFFALVD